MQFLMVLAAASAWSSVTTIRGQLKRTATRKLSNINFFHRLRTRRSVIRFSSSSASEVPSDRSSASLRVVITGGSKGLGKALAEKFLREGDRVLIASRNEDRVSEALEDLKSAAQFPSDIIGMKCDVASPSDLGLVSKKIKEEWGGMDIWICNAGSNGYTFKDLVDIPDETLNEIVTTNLLGTLYQSKEAIRTMSESGGPGFIVLLDGAGGSGEPTKLYAAYGASKAGIHQLATSLKAELTDTKLKIILLNPGIVETDLLRIGSEAFGETGRAIVDTFVSKPEEVAAEVVPQLKEIADSTLASEGILSGNFPPNLNNILLAARVAIRDAAPITISMVNPRNFVGKLSDRFNNNGS